MAFAQLRPFSSYYEVLKDVLSLLLDSLALNENDWYGIGAGEGENRASQDVKLI